MPPGSSVPPPAPVEQSCLAWISECKRSTPSSLPQKPAPTWPPPAGGRRGAGPPGGRRAPEASGGCAGRRGRGGDSVQTSPSRLHCAPTWRWGGPVCGCLPGERWPTAQNCQRKKNEGWFLKNFRFQNFKVLKTLLCHWFKTGLRISCGAPQSYFLGPILF